MFRETTLVGEVIRTRNDILGRRGEHRTVHVSGQPPSLQYTWHRFALAEKRQGVFRFYDPWLPRTQGKVLARGHLEKCHIGSEKVASVGDFPISLGPLFPPSSELSVHPPPRAL